MQTTIENTDKHTVKLTVEVPADEYSKDMDQAYRSIANQVKIPGFRKGKVPKQIIDAQIGREVVRDEFLQAAVPDYYRQAITEHDLAPITDPDIDLDEFADDSPLKFTAVVEVRPRLELTEADYSGLKIEKPSTEVAESEIDDWVTRLQERFAELEPAERPIIDGDFVTIDLKATGPLGQEIEGLSRTDYLYFVGSGEFGPQLDTDLPGAKAGEILKVTEELGEGAGEGLSGQAADMTVLIKDVKARKLPEADDDFAKTASEFDTMAELREDLRERLGELKERDVKGELRDRALQVDARQGRGRTARHAGGRRDRAPGGAREAAGRAFGRHDRAAPGGPGMGRGAPPAGLARPRGARHHVRPDPGEHRPRCRHPGRRR